MPKLSENYLPNFVKICTYFVFLDEAQAQNFRAARFRACVSVPKVQLGNKCFEDYEERLAPLMMFGFAHQYAD